MFNFLPHRKRRAAAMNAALEDMKHWSTTAWLDHWHGSNMQDLQAELDTFLPAAMDHAQASPDLANSYSAMITRFILIGVSASQTHEISAFEEALGVPMPVETT